MRKKSDLFIQIDCNTLNDEFKSMAYNNSKKMIEKKTKIENRQKKLIEQS